MNTKVTPSTEEIKPSKKPENLPYLQSIFLPFVENKWFNITMGVVTIFALFGSDINAGFMSISADIVFDDLSLIAMILFILEIIVTILAKPAEYPGNFYFWLDIFSTISLIPDIGWLWNLILNTSVSSSTSTPTQASSSATEKALKIGQISRTGARAGRVVRIVRLVRLIRIAKLFKAKNNHDEKEMDPDEPSNVGKVLSALTIKKVIMLVLVMLMILPIFDGSFNTPVSTSNIQSSGLSPLNDFKFQYNLDPRQFKREVQHYVREAGRLLYLDLVDTDCIAQFGCPASCKPIGKLQNKTIVDQWIFSTPSMDLSSVSDVQSWDIRSHYLSDLAQVTNLYRTTEFSVVFMSGYSYTVAGCPAPGCQTNCSAISVFEIRDLVTYEAQLSALKTLFIVIILGVASVVFTRDAERLVILPIERMVKVVRELAANPLSRTIGQGSNSGESGGYETALLEKTLKKIGMLLSIGFGAAGAEIIAKNLSGTGELDVMKEGKKVTGIYGFCDIRQFTDTTECLQEDVMVFVNRIGKIVHGATHQFSGCANKNIGDAFLLVWKLKVDPTKPDTWIGNPEVTRMADSALAAFLKIIIDTENSNQHGILSTYTTRADILKRFGPGYKVRMGFGLHIGWSIEGVLGTTYKIDASYLSSHVNMSNKLEESTKEFAVPLLISGDLHRVFSSSAAKLCRKLDRVIIAGKTYDYYTFDITNIPETLGEPPSVDFLDFSRDPNVAALHEGIDPRFYNIHAQAVDSYLRGDWDAAKSKFHEALELWPGDGPTTAVLHFMESNGFKPPNDWPGARSVETFSH